MVQPNNTDKIIESSPTFSAYAAIAARLDAQSRSDEAASENPDFFLSTAHQQRIDAVRDIVTAFFTDRKAVYVNHRQNRSPRKVCLTTELKLNSTSNLKRKKTPKKHRQKNKRRPNRNASCSAIDGFSPIKSM